MRNVQKNKTEKQQGKERRDYNIYIPQARKLCSCSQAFRIMAAHDKDIFYTE
jgi:hypothetical protein